MHPFSKNADSCRSDRLNFWLSTAFGLGLSPVLPGTCAALVGLGLHLLILHSLPVSGQWPALLFFFILFSALCLRLNAWAEAYWKKCDHQSFVLDEVAGYLLVPDLFRCDFMCETLLLGFILFRALDMIKVFPANYIDKRLKNRWGVLLDDCVSAVYAAAILYFLHYIR